MGLTSTVPNGPSGGASTSSDQKAQSSGDTERAEEQAPSVIRIDVDDLDEVSKRPALADYIRRLWDRRHFAIEDAKAHAYQRSRGTALGIAWLVVNPFLNAVIYFLVFGLLLQTSRGIENFPAYLVVGLNFFRIMRTALNTGSGVMQTRNAQNLMSSFAFPRAVIVVSWTIRQFREFLPVLLATLIFIVAVPPHAMPNWRWLIVIPVLFIGFVFVFGLTLLTSVITTAFPDMKFIWPLLGRFWFYVSGVFFSLNMFESMPLVTTVMQINPGYVFLSMNRDLLVYQTVPSLGTWLYMIGWSVLLTLIGFLLFWSREETFGRER